jgi:hypothetical protein
MPQNNYENRNILINDIIEGMDMSDLAEYVYDNMQDHFEAREKIFQYDWAIRFGEDDSKMKNFVKEKKVMPDD